MDIEVEQRTEGPDDAGKKGLLISMAGDLKGKMVHVEMDQCLLYGGSVEYDNQCIVMEIPFDKLKEFVDHHRTDK